MSVIKQLTKKTSSGTETHDIGAEASNVTMSDGTTVESAIMEKALYGACMQNNILHITQFDGRDIQVNLPISKSADIVIAAYDAPDNWQAGADYVCDGKADDVEINAAINALGSNGGKILLSTGTFYITNHIFLDNNATIEGMGDSTRLCTATNLYQYGTTNNRALFCNNSFSNNGTKYIINIKNLKICNNYSLCDSIIHNLNKRTRLQNVTLTSSYSVPANLGYTARSFTYSDNPGCLWGTGSNDSGDELTEIIDCRVLTDYAVSWSVGSQFIIDRCIFSGFATISVSGYYTTLRVLSSSPYSISSTHITINITGSNNVVYRCPSCTITDTGSNNVIS